MEKKHQIGNLGLPVNTVICLSYNVLTLFMRIPFMTYRPGFSEKEILSFPLNFPHTREIATKKVTKTPILPNCQVSNGFFSITSVLQNGSTFFCLSFSRATKI